MAEKKKFLLRIDENIYASLEKWAADDLRSINAQIEFLLKDLLIKNNRLKNISADSSVESEAKKNNPG
ncbi:MAG: hypothetical protein CO129_05875 [Ignavibacteriales bacterium CG_4_9_14_3_um_filter_34_10]|nr:MAG: hypothetical protein CO129_05875 [Ignavibacteriales bacterium CG_4_9_14_3_um_filter_34_10]